VFAFFSVSLDLTCLQHDIDLAANGVLFSSCMFRSTLGVLLLADIYVVVGHRCFRCHCIVICEDLNVPDKSMEKDSAPRVKGQDLRGLVLRVPKASVA
jgi:hypothetical protein